MTSSGGTDTHTSAGLVRVLAGGAGIWTSALELAALPTSGSAWNEMLDEADSPLGVPLVGYQGDNTDMRLLAKALVFARTGDPNTPNLPHWPAFTAAHRPTMVFANVSRVVNDPIREQRIAMFEALGLAS